MKVQVLVSSLVCSFFCVVAQASPKQSGVDLFRKFTMDNLHRKAGHKKTAAKATDPIRYANLRMKIMKDTFQKNENGGMDYKSEVVCEKKVAIPVWDFRDNGQDDGPFDKSVSCDSTIGGANASVHLYSAMALSSEDIWDEQKSVDIKAFSEFLYVDGYAPSDFPSSRTFGATRDLNQTSFLNVLQPPVKVSCTVDQNNEETCTTDTPEFFWAVTEIEDKQ